MAAFIKPQVHLQLALCIPGFYYDQFVRHGSPAFNQALDFLLSEYVIFQLFVNDTESNRRPNVFRPPRHGDNEVSGLVFVVVTSYSERVYLAATVWSCMVSFSVLN